MSAAQSWSDNLTDEGVSPTFKDRDEGYSHTASQYVCLRVHLIFTSSFSLKTGGVVGVGCNL